MLDLIYKNICPFCGNPMSNIGCKNKSKWRNLNYNHVKLFSYQTKSNKSIQFFSDKIYCEYNYETHIFIIFEELDLYNCKFLIEIPYFDFSSEQDFLEKLKIIKVFT